MPVAERVLGFIVGVLMCGAIFCGLALMLEPGP